MSPNHKKKSGRLDLNQRPPAPHTGALTKLRYAPIFSLFSIRYFSKIHKGEEARNQGKHIWKPYPSSPPYRTGKTKGGRASLDGENALAPIRRAKRVSERGGSGGLCCRRGC